MEREDITNHYDSKKKHDYETQLAPKKTNNHKHLIHFELGYTLLVC